MSATLKAIPGTAHVIKSWTIVTEICADDGSLECRWSSVSTVIGRTRRKGKFHARRNWKEFKLFKTTRFDVGVYANCINCVRQSQDMHRSPIRRGKEEKKFHWFCLGEWIKWKVQFSGKSSRPTLPTQKFTHGENFKSTWNINFPLRLAYNHGTKIDGRESVQWRFQGNKPNVPTNINKTKQQTASCACLQSSEPEIH